MRYLLADKGYDADNLRRSLRNADTVIPDWRNRKRTIRYAKQRYAGRHFIENNFCRLEDICPVYCPFRQACCQLPIRLSVSNSTGVTIAMEYGLQISRLTIRFRIP